MKNRVFIIAGAVLLFAALLVALNIKKTSGVGLKKTDRTSASGILKQAKSLETAGNLLSAKSLYQELITNFSGSSEIMNWQKKIDELNIRLLFSNTITPKSTLYEIRPGDSLAKIARDFKTTQELIIKSNNISGNKIFPGRKIKVWTSPFSIVVDKSQNVLMLKSDEEVFKTYIVSTGANNSTPVGTFKIINKLQNPTWFKAGAVVPASSPENVLGTRWMGFDLAGYGIHGTTEPQNLGKQVTQGCVRMANAEVEELYTIVPQGTEVTIVD